MNKEIDKNKESDWTQEKKWSESDQEPHKLNKCPVHVKRKKGTDESFELKKVPMKKVYEVIDIWG